MACKLRIHNVGPSEATAQQDVNCRVASSESYAVVLIMHVAVQFN